MAGTGLESALGKMFGGADRPEALDPKTNSAQEVARRDAEIAHHDEMNKKGASLLGIDPKTASAEQLEGAGDMYRGLTALGLSPQLLEMVMNIAKEFGQQNVQQNGKITGADLNNLNAPSQTNETLLAQQRAAEASQIPNMA